MAYQILYFFYEKVSKSKGKTFPIGQIVLFYDKIKNLGVAQLVARYLGVVEAAGSSPVTQTKKVTVLCGLSVGA